MKITGQGGYWVVQGAGGGLVRIDNSEYEVDAEAVIDDVTDSSASLGVLNAAGLAFAQGLAGLAKVNSVTMTVPEDDQFFLTALGLAEGQVANIYLRRGRAAQWDLVTGTIVRSVRNQNPQDGKARRVTVTTEFGSIQRNVGGPAGFP